MAIFDEREGGGWSDEETEERKSEIRELHQKEEPERMRENFHLDQVKQNSRALQEAKARQKLTNPNNLDQTFKLFKLKKSDKKLIEN